MLASNPTSKQTIFDLHLANLCNASPCRAKPYSNFKPGQTTLDRDYYKDATHEVPSGQQNLQNYQRFGSDYGRGVSGAVKPGDYKVPSKDANNLSK